MPSSLSVTVRSLGFSGALGSASWSCVLRCSLRWAFSACFSCRCRSFWRFAKVVLELPAMSTPDSEFCEESQAARPFLYCTLCALITHQRKQSCQFQEPTYRAAFQFSRSSRENGVLMPRILIHRVQY